VGALAIGTTVGATLAGLTPNQLGAASALLQIPIHALYLVLYWRFARQAGLAVPLAQKIDDIVWTALLMALVFLANRFSDIEIAGAAPTAVVLALRFWRDERPDGRRALAALRANAPYVALTLALCATRLVAPLRDLLNRCCRGSPTTTSRPSHLSTHPVSGCWRSVWPSFCSAARHWRR